MRDFFNEIEDSKFKNVSYGLYNKLDDDSFVKYLNTKYKQCFSIDDFEYQEMELSDKEKFLFKMRNREFGVAVLVLKQKLSKYDMYKVYSDNDKGKIYVVRLKNHSL